jgi:hypothetical protein
VRDVHNPSSFAHHYVEVNGIAVDYVEAGEGPMVLLRHSATMIASAQNGH